MKFWGKVSQGKQRGKGFGYPTANLRLHKKFTEGVYISLTRYNETIYKSMTFIGKVKTFDEKIYHAETYIFDFNENIYGKWISIELLKKTRGNMKFASEKELIEQMKLDKEEALAYFNKNEINTGFPLSRE